MKKKLIIFAVAAFLVGMTCSSFAATMNISSAVAFSESGISTPASARLSTILSDKYFLFPNFFVFSIGTALGTNINSNYLPIPVQTSNNEMHQVPESFTLLLLGSGLVGLYLARRKLR